MARRTSFVAAAVAVALAGCSDTPSGPEPSATAGPAHLVHGAAGPTVMTRNLYLGTELDPVLAATSPAEVIAAATQAWAEIQATNFPARAGALADEIARTRPDLIGLQEVTLYTVQSPSDAVLGGTTPATDVAYDFLQLLLDSLTARGLHYTAVAQVVNTSIEVPVFTGAGPIPYDDVRFTDRDAILARADVATSNAQGDVFATHIPLQIGGMNVPLLRGWTSVDATIGASTFRFVNTHLEVQSFAPVQTAQAAELLALFAAAPLPVVMVGDFNSAADNSQTPTYAMILAAGYDDVWTPRGSDGYTCCHAKDLSNTLPELDQRLDIVFVRGFGPAPQVGARTQIVGNTVGDRQRAGMWASDHAGVVATLRLPPAHAQ
jgi:endonuclease/exonuclease/phosphatase family metal-dependent hydrolase